MKKTIHNDDDVEEEAKVFVCPFSFSGPTANRELKLHLAHANQVPSNLPKSSNGEKIKCPMYFFNEQDAQLHIQESVTASKERETPDLRTFWERTEEEEIQRNKVISTLLKDEDEKNQRRELERQKRRLKKLRAKAIQNQHKELKKKLEQEKEKQLQKQMEEERKRRQEQEKRRKCQEVYKNMKTIILDHILKKSRKNNR